MDQEHKGGGVVTKCVLMKRTGTVRPLVGFLVPMNWEGINQVSDGNDLTKGGAEGSIQKDVGDS